MLGRSNAGIRADEAQRPPQGLVHKKTSLGGRIVEDIRSWAYTG